MRSAAGASRTRSTRSPIGHLREPAASRASCVDAEVAAASAQPRDYPAPDPAEAAKWREAQANRHAQAEAGVGQLAGQVVSEYH